jgi:hypothetical protein
VEQHNPKLNLMQRAIRAKICVKCYERPARSESWLPTQERTCEAKCGIFENLPRLIGIAVRPDPPRTSLDVLVRNSICIRCTVSDSAGDYCASNLARTCPLSRYSQDVIDVLRRTCEV